MAARSLLRSASAPSQPDAMAQDLVPERGAYLACAPSNYSYGDPAHVHAATGAGGTAYTYDANGNMKTRGADTLAYDYENRMTSVTNGNGTTTFVYDGDGGRVKKTIGTSTTVYIGKLYECTGGGCSKYIFAGAQRIALHLVSGVATYYYHTDHLGSSSVITDHGGAQMESLAYLPYGQTRLRTGMVNMHHQYTGQELDDSTGLYFYGARYYDPSLGRFILPDTIVPNPRDPQDFNRYSYVNNNPLTYTDPTGHWKWRNYLKSVATVEIIAATAVLAATGNPIAIGALAGEIGGVVHANRTGQDVLTSVIKGGAIGAAIGAAIWAGCTYYGCGVALQGSAGAGGGEGVASVCLGACPGALNLGPGLAAVGGAGAASALPTNDLTPADIDNSINDIAKSDWGSESEGLGVVNRLKELAKVDHIIFGTTKDSYGEYLRVGDRPSNRDWIILNALNIQAQGDPRRLEGHLVHEGTHAVYGHDRRGVWEFERKAYGNQIAYETSRGYKWVDSFEYRIIRHEYKLDQQ